MNQRSFFRTQSLPCASSKNIAYNQADPTVIYRIPGSKHELFDIYKMDKMYTCISFWLSRYCTHLYVLVVYDTGMGTVCSIIYCSACWSWTAFKQNTTQTRLNHYAKMPLSGFIMLAPYPNYLVSRRSQKIFQVVIDHFHLTNEDKHVGKKVSFLAINFVIICGDVSTTSDLLTTFAFFVCTHHANPSTVLKN